GAAECPRGWVSHPRSERDQGPEQPSARERDRSREQPIRCSAMWRHRADGTLAKGLSNERRVMPYLMRGRNESVVYFRQDVDLVKADAFIRAWNQANPLLRIDVFHLACWAMRATFEYQPGTNRFVVGGRIYDRDGIWISYAVKQKLETGAPMVVVKRR